MNRPDIVVSQVVDAPLEAVWESWADFGGIYKFHDDVSRTTILTAAVPRGVGAVRLCELADGRNEIEERIVGWVPMQKLGIEFKRTSLPIAQALAEFDFSSIGRDVTRVEMKMQFTPKGLALRLMKPVVAWKMRTGFKQLLLNNKHFVERSLPISLDRPQ